MSPLHLQYRQAGFDQLSPGRLPPDSVGQQRFFDNTETALFIAAQQQFLVFTKIRPGLGVSEFPEPFDPAHPGRVGQVKPAPGFGDNFSLRRRRQPARQSVIPVNRNGMGGNQIQPRIFFQRFDLPGEALRIRHVILIHARQIPAAGQIDRFIEPCCKPLVCTIFQYADSLIPYIVNILKRIVRRAVINNQQFPVGERLPDNRKHGKPKTASRIEYRHGYGNQRRIAWLNLGH